MKNQVFRTQVIVRRGPSQLLVKLVKEIDDKMSLIPSKVSKVTDGTLILDGLNTNIQDRDPWTASLVRIRRPFGLGIPSLRSQNP